MPAEKELIGTGNKNNLNDSIEYALEGSKAEFSELEKMVLKSEVKKIVEESIILNPFPKFGGLQAGLNENEDIIVDYIVDGNLNSGKNQQLEEYINDLSSVSLVWKLKMLVDSPNLETALKEIKEKEKKIMDKNKKKLENLEESYNLANNQEKPAKSVLDTFKEKVKGIGSHLVDLSKVPEKIGGLMCNILAGGEEYFGQKYVSGKMDCSMFLSILLCIGQGIKPKRLGTSRSFSQSYPKVKSEDVRCGDIMYNEGHVEMVVGIPYERGGKRYVMTIGSSTDTSRTDPMYDSKGNKMENRNGVGYREREIYPKPRHPYTYYRPPYNLWAEKRSES